MAYSELRKRKLEEYEMQLFNFHSRAVYATLKNIVHERTHSTISKMCETIKEVYKLNSENLAVLMTNQKQLEKIYYEAIVSHLKNIESIVNKYIAVPSNVLLEEDKYQRTQYSDAEFESMKQKLKDLQERGKRATILNAVLKEELQVFDQFSITEDDVNNMCNVIETDLACSDTDDKMYQLVEDYRQFSTSIFDVPVTEKRKYNTMKNLKCKDFNLSEL
nr:protein MIS12 homolog [Osmia lignaria]